MAKQHWDGVALFRVVLAVWLASAPWFLPGSDGWHRLSGAVSAALMLVVAWFCERHPWLRFVQAAVGLWVMFSAPLLEPGPIMINSIVCGMAVLASAFATRAMFTE